MPDPIDRHAPDDDDAPTRAQRPPRVLLHPKLDPRRIPTLRGIPVARLLAAPAGEPDSALLSRRGGVTLAWVTAFIAASYLAILVAVVLAMR